MNPRVNPALTGERATPVTPRFHLSSLGELRLEGLDAGELLPGRRKELALLVFLARRAPRDVGREELAALLWGERESAKARQSLRHVLLQLRRALGDAIDVTPERARVDPDVVELDVTALERDLGEGRLFEAVTRWRGDFLAGMEDAGGESFRAWVEAEREGLRRRIASALDRLITEALSHAQSDKAVAWAARWTEALPLDEQAHRRLIEALNAAGRPDEALARHATFTARLREELGRDPSPTFKALAGGLARAARQQPRISGPGSAALLTPDMVGREAVLAELIAAWYEARAGRSTVVLVAGDEGLGKTRLCQEFVRWVKSNDSGACVLAGRAHEADRDVSWSAARQLLAGLAEAPGLLGAAPAALRAVARIVPAVGGRELPGHADDGPTSAADQVEMAAAVCEVLEAVAVEVPVLVVFDDAPFADAGTQQILAVLLSRSSPGVMLVMTGQPDALSDSPLVDELRQSRSVRRVQLQPLGTVETEALIASMVALAPEDRQRLAARLHAESEGNPYYVTELVFALADDGTLSLGRDGQWRVERALLERRLPLPSGVRGAVRRRLAALSDDERLCLEAAAAGGRRADPAFLERTTGLGPDRLAVALDQLLARRLLRETSTETAGHGTAYEFTHEMVRRVAQRESAAMPSPIPSPARRSRRPWQAALSIAAIAVAGATILMLRPGGKPQAPPSPLYERTAIAVLPFDNLSAEGPHAYFAGGLHDELLTQLSKVAALKVISRASVRGYAGTGTPLTQIARELRVGSVVEGSVQVVGRRLRVNVALVDAATGAHLWAERYDRTLEDAFAIQSDVARQVVAAVGAVLTTKERQGLAAAPSTNAEAYRLYLQGREYYTRPGRGRQNIEIAQRLYERALALDPSFALARAALSEVHGRMHWYRWDPSPARVARQLEEAEAALRLAPDLPQAHVAMGLAHYWGRRNYGPALEEFRVALEGLPNDAEVWVWIGAVHRRMGRWGEVLRAFEKATELDPRDANLFYNLGGTTLVILRRYADAVRAFDHALSLAPDLHTAALWKGWTYVRWQGQLDTLRAILSSVPSDAELGLETGAAQLLRWERQADSVLRVLEMARVDVFDNVYFFQPRSLHAAWAHQLRGNGAAARVAFDSARVLLDSVVKELPDDWRVHAARGLALAGLGRRDEALREARWLQQSQSRVYGEDAFSGPMRTEDRARILAQAGEADAALDEIERLLAKPSWLSVHALRLDPLWDPIRDHPRFKELLAKYAGR